MPPANLIPAAQYLRMSTEHQQYSLENQGAAVKQYADAHGFEIVKTYADAGKSGVTLDKRKALSTLLQDVTTRHAGFEAILVYDVSRWGRFQDIDEGAHYDFVCNSSGVPVHYCAEPFADDGSLLSSILKALKRAMAAEFSRELGTKELEGKKRLAQLGFRVGGSAGFGFRRLIVPAKGRRKRRLERGEWKYLTADRITLVPGPKEEVDCIRQMYALALHKRFADVARELNTRGLTFRDGRPWNYASVYRLLTNPKYVGCNVWRRTEQRVCTSPRRLPPQDWIVVPGAFAPIVDQETFDHVQAAHRRRNRKISDKKLLNKLKRLLAANGRLTGVLINQSRSTPHTSSYIRRFGSLMETYNRIGYRPPARTMAIAERAARTWRFRSKLLERLEKGFPGRVTRCVSFGGWRFALHLDTGLTVSLIVCPCYKTRALGRIRWQLSPVARERGLITLVCLLRPGNDEVQSYYLFPRIDHPRIYQIKTEHDPWLKQGIRLRSLSGFYEAVRSMQDTITPI